MSKRKRETDPAANANFSAHPPRTPLLGGEIEPRNELTAETPSTPRKRRDFFQ